MKLAASTRAGAQCKLIILRSVKIQSMGINYWSFQICKTFKHGVCACVRGSSNAQSIWLISLLLYCWEWLDTWDSARLTSAEREKNSLGRKIRGILSACCLQSHGWKTAQVWVQQLRISKQREKSILLKHLWSRVHGQRIEHRDPWLNLSSHTLAQSTPPL